MSPAEGARHISSNTVRVDIRGEACLCVLMLPVPRLAVSCPSCGWNGSGPPSLFSCVFGPARLRLRTAGTSRSPTARKSCTVEVGCGSNAALILCHCRVLQHWSIEVFLARPKMSHCFEEFTEPWNAPRQAAARLTWSWGSLKDRHSVPPIGQNFKRWQQATVFNSDSDRSHRWSLIVKGYKYEKH